MSDDLQRDFPDDIVANVLHRLPVKSLMACACVCKPWRDLLRSPSFVKAHLSKAVGVASDNTPGCPNPQMLLLRLCPESREGYTLLHVTPTGSTTAAAAAAASSGSSKDQRGSTTSSSGKSKKDHRSNAGKGKGKNRNRSNAANSTKANPRSTTTTTDLPSPRTMPLPPLTPTGGNRYLRLASSCAGAVLLADDTLHFTSNYALWNPTTHRLVRLPEPLIRRETHGSYEASAGLAYDHATGDFKVLRFVHFMTATDADGRRHAKMNRAEVFSLKSQTWTDVTEDAGMPTRYRAVHHSPQAFANGYLHYIGLLEMGRVFLNSVVAFDVSKEEFRRIGFPSALANDDSCSNAVFAYDGPAAVARPEGSAATGSAATIGILHRHTRLPMGWDVWVLTEHGNASTWAVLGRIYDCDIGVAPPDPVANNGVFHMMNNPIPFPVAFLHGWLFLELPDDHVVGVDVNAYVEVTWGIRSEAKRKKKAARTVTDLGMRGKAAFFDLVDGIMTPVRTSCGAPHIETLALADVVGDAVVVGVGEDVDPGSDEDCTSLMDQVSVLMKRYGKEAFIPGDDDDEDEDEPGLCAFELSG